MLVRRAVKYPPLIVGVKVVRRTGVGRTPAIRSAGRLAQAGVLSSIGSVGDPIDTQSRLMPVDV